jgi:prepilin-type N-terminal cleavage/methylation domain-containing protein
MHRHRSRTSEAGYSLAEMALVVAIIGIVAALATPSFLTYYQASRLRVAAEEVAAFINQGRQLGIRENAGVCVHISSAAVQYYLGSVVSSGACTGGTAWVGPGTDAAGNMKASESVGLAKDTDFAFNYLGAANNGATITVTNLKDGQALLVCVALSGRVRIRGGSPPCV